jgi:hypothetical protein
VISGKLIRFYTGLKQRAGGLGTLISLVSKPFLRLLPPNARKLTERMGASLAVR